MTKHFSITLILTGAILLLPACGEAQIAQKAAVTVKAAAKADPAPPKDAPAKPAAKVEMQSATNAVPKPGATAASKPGAPLTAANAADDDEAPPLTVPAGFRYEAHGRRDPFVNPVPKPVGEVAKAVERIVRPDGLPGVLVSEVRLTGIIHAADVTMTKALLAVGKRTYFVRTGDSLFDGVIKEIRPSEVVFTMVSTSTKQPVNKETVLSTGKTSLTAAGERK